MKPRMLGVIIFALISLGLSLATKAETTAHLESPSAEITKSEALQRLAKGDPVYACTKKIAGNGRRPIKVKGSKDTWHSAIPKGIDEAFDALATGKAVFFCELVYGDAATGSIRKVQD